MIADDQFVVRQILEILLAEFGLKDRALVCKNGVEVVDYFKKFFDELEQSNVQPAKEKRLRHVSLLLMDINMPFKSGLEAKKEVCEMF